MKILFSAWTGVHFYVFWRLASIPFVTRHLSHRILFGTAAILWAAGLLPRLLDRRGFDALARHFVTKISRRIGVPAIPLQERDFKLLQSYSWPGNIRELETVIERALITSQHGRLNIVLPDASEKATLLPVDGTTVADEGVVLTEDQVREMETQNVVRALEKSGWKIYGRGGAAELLGVKPSTLATRVKAWGITRDR